MPLSDDGAALRLKDEDDVAVALRPLDPGGAVRFGGVAVVLASAIPTGHKFATRPIAAGALIRKYGQVIGRASAAIGEGEHVHVHNVEGTRGRGDLAPECHPELVEGFATMKTFMGYKRANGAVGIRNHVLVLPSVMCANHVVELIGRKVPDVVTVQHPTGCSQVGADFEQTKRTMAGFAANPNVAAVLVVGLGCETNESKALAEEIAARGQRVEVIGIQESGGTTETIARGVELAKQLLREAAAYERTECPVSALIVGTECGGSDGFSGITANPALGQRAIVSSPKAAR